jgi:periplasmic divalent cation tolerance protein
MNDTLLVVTTVPEQLIAHTLAKAVLAENLAACINIIPHVTSIYRWQQDVCETDEYLLLIKTQQSCYSRLETFIRENHRYELPEIIALPITQGLPAYLGWIKESTQA